MYSQAETLPLCLSPAYSEALRRLEEGLSRGVFASLSRVLFSSLSITVRDPRSSATSSSLPYHYSEEKGLVVPLSVGPEDLLGFINREGPAALRAHKRRTLGMQMEHRKGDAR
jgi:hypothetical protein